VASPAHGEILFKTKGDRASYAPRADA